MQKYKVQQPEALAELAETAQEPIPSKGDRSQTADDNNKLMPADNSVKQDVAETPAICGSTW